MKKHIEHILTAAIRAPTGDNCQPFRFKVENSNLIRIRHVEERAQHYFNLENWASLIALGGVIETIFIEARAQGFHPELVLSENIGSSQNKEWALIKLIAASHPTNDSLANSYQVRWTCRQPLTSEMLSLETLNLCREQGKIASTNVEINYGKPTEVDFIRTIKTAELFVWSVKEAAMDFLKMVRFSANKSQRSTDGIKTEELGIKMHEKFSLKLMRSFPNIIPIFLKLGLKKMTQAVAERNYSQSGGLIVFLVDAKKDPKMALIEVGRVALRTWSFLNQQKYAVQPMTSVSLLGYQFQHQHMRKSVTKEFNSLFESTADLWKKYFAVPTGKQVVWAFRVGRLKESTVRQISNRIALQDLLDTDIDPVH